MHGFTTTAVGLVAALAAPAAAFFRMPCPGRILTERADPIIYPGVVSAHVHTIAGGNGFNFDMTYDDARSSDCSSCPVKADLSNYWTPKLYYQYQNGSFQDVSQAGDGNGVYGGMTVYYLQRPGPDNDTLHAFPEGFRMVAGDPFKRTNGTDFASQAVSFVCLDYSGTSSQSSGFPNKNCPDGLRAQIFFPSCWDGVNLDSSNHESHMSYPMDTAYDNGRCPSSHPVHLISIFYEIIYNTGDFSSMWYGNSQPFVFAMGDPTGFGMHGDFVNGWDVATLQSAVNTCTDDSGLLSDCPVLDLFTNQESQACIVPPRINEQVTGVLAALPGCNPVTPGPSEAVAVTNCPAPAIGPFQQYYTDVTSSLGWEYIGCGSDSNGNRTLQGSAESTGSMTVETCIKYCSGLGYSYAGLEYSSQCYCDNTLPWDRAPVSGVLGNCFSTCSGNSSEYCGGSDALSLYKNCKGGACTNAAYVGPVGSGAASSSASSSSKASSASSSSKVSSASVSSSSSKATSSSTASSSTSSISSAVAAAKVASSATTLSTSSSKSSSTLTSTTTIASSSVKTTSSTKTSTSATTTTTRHSFFSAVNKHHESHEKAENAQAKARMAAAEAVKAEAEKEAAAVKAKLAKSKSKKHVRRHLHSHE